MPADRGTVAVIHAVDAPWDEVHDLLHLAAGQSGGSLTGQPEQAVPAEIMVDGERIILAPRDWTMTRQPMVRTHA